LRPCQDARNAASRRSHHFHGCLRQAHA
jgi:hypothetical protein